MAYQEGHQILDYVINGSDFHLKDAADNYVQDNQGGDALGFHTPLEWIATRMYGFPSSVLSTTLPISWDELYDGVAWLQKL